MHAWDLSPKEAIALQESLKTKVKLFPLATPLTVIGGCDVSMNRFAKEGYGGFITLTYPALSPLEESVERSPLSFPYIPGLLSFREIPMLLRAWEGLSVKPGLVVVDGVGVAHPRRMGIASHLGLALGIPTIGCAKSVLTGVYDEPPDEPGAFTHLRDPRTLEVIGAALRTKRGVKPVFVSAGHLVTLEESIDILRNSVRAHRIPEPTRLAHEAVNRHRKEYAP